jgi:hypothetical protein
VKVLTARSRGWHKEISLLQQSGQRQVDRGITTRMKLNVFGEQKYLTYNPETVCCGQKLKHRYKARLLH